MAEKYQQIPKETDILVTHSPHKGIMDEVKRKGKKKQAGSQSLYNRICDVRPRVSVFGHLHNNHGTLFREDSQTLFINAASFDNRGNAHSIITLNLPKI